MTNTVHRATVTVTGRVQGVGFRHWTVAEVRALRLPVTGTVRNQSDGTVEVVAESADRGAVEQLLSRLKTGPNLAHVDAVHAVYEVDGEPRYVDFGIGY